MSKQPCVLYHLYKFFPPRIRRVSLMSIYNKYERFSIIFLHPCFYLLYRIINIFPQWRTTRKLNVLLFRASKKLFGKAMTVITQCPRKKKGQALTFSWA
ncbi:MAG: hypothetical protein DRI61_01325 [Chloroflexi bacterium]|nr:MAG: hypothetical protein DRI61_01325 [Chloroflexota bacterium]